MAFLSLARMSVSPTRTASTPILASALTSSAVLMPLSAIKVTSGGTSFLTNETGDVIARAGSEEEEILTAEYDFEKLRDVRLEWGIFRDRRPEMYGLLTE